MKVTSKAAIISAIMCAFALAFSPQVKADQVMTTDEAKIAAMLRDEIFTSEEQTEVASLMKSGKFYGMKIKLRYDTDRETISRVLYGGATPDRMKTIENALSNTNYSSLRKMKDVRVWLWHTPTPEVTSATQARSKEAILRMYQDIVAIKEKYPELAMFDKDHVRITDNSLHYSPKTGSEGGKIPLPLISIVLYEPYLGGGLSQKPHYGQLFPAQKLELTGLVLTEDDELSSRISDIEARDIEPLIQAEIALDSYPLRVNW